MDQLRSLILFTAIFNTKEYFFDYYKVIIMVQ